MSSSTNGRRTSDAARPENAGESGGVAPLLRAQPICAATTAIYPGCRCKRPLGHSGAHEADMGEDGRIALWTQLP